MAGEMITRVSRFFAKGAHGYWIVAAVAVFSFLVLLAVPLIVTSASSEFFGRYQELALNYDELQTSSHAGIPCAGCHAATQGAVVHAVELAGDFYTGLVSAGSSPRFLEFESPTSAACLACHEDDWSHDADRLSKIPHPAHLRVASETRECVTCHKWTAHEEVYMEKHKEMPFSGVCVAYGCHVGTKTAEECSSCHHILSDSPQAWIAEHSSVAQTTGTNSCLESCHDADQCRLCHTTGERPVFEGRAVETGLEAIEKLHVRDDWTAVAHGPVALDDQSKCMQCHVSDGECRACHAHKPASHEPESTWIARHKDVITDDRQCLTCHEQSWCDECHDQFKEMR